MPNSNQPERFECRGFVVAWMLSEECRSRDSDVMRHIDQCHTCSSVVFGERVVAAGPLVKSRRSEWTMEPVKSDERRVFGRRHLLKAAAAGLAVLAAGAGGVSAWRSPATGSQNAVARAFEDWNLGMDADWASDGLHALARRLLMSTDDDAIRTLRWIDDRQHSALYGVIVIEAADSRIRVRKAAIGLMGNMVPLDLKPHLPSINGIALAETDPFLRAELQRLARVVSAA